MTLKMRSLPGGDHVAVPLGKSLAARTIVWEEVKGVRMDAVLGQLRWNNSTARKSARALFQAGAWLRKVHEASLQGKQTIHVASVIHNLANMPQAKKQSGLGYVSVALEILKHSIIKMGRDSLSVPVALTHGDFSLPNFIWDKQDCRLTVVDFELADFRPACHDLFALVSHLRAQLLNPLIPKSVIRAWEKSFWTGYGPVSPEISVFVEALALSRIFYHHLPRLLTRGERRGWIAGQSAWVFRTFLEDFIVTRRLDLPPELDLPGRNWRSRPFAGLRPYSK